LFAVTSIGLGQSLCRLYRKAQLRFNGSTTLLIGFVKAAGKEANLCYMGHLMMENRNSLIVDARLTEANGTAERAGWQPRGSRWSPLCKQPADLLLAQDHRDLARLA